MLTTRSHLLKLLRTYPKLSRACPQASPRTFHTNRCLYNAGHKLDENQPVNEDLDAVRNDVDAVRNESIVDDEDDSAPLRNEDEDEDDEMPRIKKKLMSDDLIHPEKEVQMWLTGLSGERLRVLDLPGEIYGLAPRMDMLFPVILRQLKYKIQSEPWGSEYDLFADRFAEKLYHNRPELKPWLSQGIAWKQSPFTKPNDIMWDSTSHDPVPHYNGNIPWKLRMSGLRALLSLKMRYDKLVIVSDLDSSAYGSPEALRAVLDKRGFTSTLMITGKQIVPAVQRKNWKRKGVFPNPEPGIQRVYEAARNTYACELRETEGLDVWSALLYDTLILDLAALEALNYEISLALEPSSIPNMSLQKSLSEVDAEGALFKLPPRFKDVQVINIDNL